MLLRLYIKSRVRSELIILSFQDFQPRLVVVVSVEPKVKNAHFLCWLPLSVFGFSRHTAVLVVWSNHLCLVPKELRSTWRCCYFVFKVVQFLIQLKPFLMWLKLAKALSRLVVASNLFLSHHLYKFALQILVITLNFFIFGFLSYLELV